MTRAEYLKSLPDEEFLRFEENRHYGYKSPSGEILIPAQYSYAPENASERMKVWVDGKCGYINKAGEEVMPIIYDDLFGYCNEARPELVMYMAEKDGKYYFYVSTNWCGIGVAVGDSPYGPFKDALGKPLLTNADCPGTNHSWACIDPAVYQDEEGNAWLYWGNGKCYVVMLVAVTVVAHCAFLGDRFRILQGQSQFAILHSNVLCLCRTCINLICMATDDSILTHPLNLNLRQRLERSIYLSLDLCGGIKEKYIQGNKII